MEPLFILGITPRSGSNLLRSSILLHPDICQANVVGEDFLLRHSDQIITYANKLEKSWSDIWNWGSINKSDQKNRLLQELSSGLLKYLQPDDQAKYYLTTTPYTIGAENIDQLFPSVKLILLTRDGQDAVESGVLGSFWNYFQGFELWSQSAKRIHQLSTRQNTLVLKYEDLIHDRDIVVHKVIKFLGMDESLFPFQELDELPVFGSSTNKVEGEFKYEIKEKPEDFKPTKRSENWSNYRHYAFNRSCGKYQELLGYTSVSQSGNPFFLLRYWLNRSSYHWNKRIKTLLKLKRSYANEFGKMIKAK